MNLSSLISPITSFFGGIQTYLIIGAITLAVGGASGAWVGYRIESGKVAAIQTADAKAQTQAVSKQARADKAQSAVDVKAAIDWQAKYDADNLPPAIIHDEVVRYVTVKADTVTCIPVSLERLLHAYAGRVDPASLPSTPGQSDDACSDVSASEVASWFKDYSDKANTNADHVDALEAWIAANHAAQETP